MQHQQRNVTKKEGLTRMATPNTQKAQQNTKAAPPVVQAADGQVLVSSTKASGKRGRVKKEDMPFNIYFVNDKNEASGRVPDNVKYLQVKGSDNKIKNINLSDIPEDVQTKLIADGLKKRLLPYIKDVKKTNLEELYSITDTFISDVSSGKLYEKKEGDVKPGRTFDFDFWLDVAKLTAEIQVKNKVAKARLMTDEDRKGLRAKLEAMTPKDRNEKIKVWKNNKVMLFAFMKVKQARDEEKLKKMSADTDFDITSEF